MKILSVGLSIFLSASFASSHQLPIGTWVPQSGDTFVVDTKENIGYLVHENASYLAFPVVTGQRKTVHYLGLTYDAATPDTQWRAESEEYKGDHITFGPTGRFFRLSDDTEATSYGIHGHAYADAMLAKPDRYRSMGCIIVNERMLDIIEKTFNINNGLLDVLTTDGKPQNIASAAI